MGDWESIFREKGKVFLEPVEGMLGFIKLLKDHKAKKILDLGCGTGRHTVLLAKEGFEVYSTDVSETGLKTTRQWLKNQGLQADIIKASCYEEFAFEDSFFDGLISTQVIHHNTHDKILFCISEIERVLKPKGAAFITFATEESQNIGGQRKRKEIAPRTFVPLEGDEKGVVHYFYDETQLKKDFAAFEILDIFYDQRRHLCLLGAKN